MHIKILRLLRIVYVINRAILIHDWKFNDTNRFYLISLIPPENQDTFSFDYSSYDYREYGK